MRIQAICRRIASWLRRPSQAQVRHDELIAHMKALWLQLDDLRQAQATTSGLILRLSQLQEASQEPLRTDE